MRLVSEAREAIDGPTPGNGPQVRAVERALLGCLMNDWGFVAVAVSYGLKADHFASACHRAIFAAMLARRAKKERANAVLLAVDLEGHKAFEDTPVGSYLSLCLDDTDVECVPEYIAVVKDAACARRIVKGAR